MLYNSLHWTCRIYYITKAISWTDASKKKQLCYSCKFPLNSSFRPAFRCNAHNPSRGQTIITSSSVTSNKYRAFCEARQELWTHNVSVECTWHDNKHWHTHTRTFTLSHTYRGGARTHGRKSPLSPYYRCFSTYVRSPYLVPQCRLYPSFSFAPNEPRCTFLSHARNSYAPRNALTPINELPAGSNSFLTDVGTPRAHDPLRSTCLIDRHDTEETIALLDREQSR